MTDKIIIKNCPHANLSDWATYSCRLYNPYLSEDKAIVKYGTCASNENCPYKQLARKTEECEKLKQDFFEMQDKFACEMQARLYHQSEWLKMSEQLQAEQQKVKELEEENEMNKVNALEFRKALLEIRTGCKETFTRSYETTQFKSLILKVLEEVIEDEK